MGAATSLYAAIKYPTRVRAIILLRPPPAWQHRTAVQTHLLECAKKVEEINGPGDVYNFVLRGAAVADLPPLLDDAAYARIVCPVLLLCVKGVLHFIFHYY